MIRDVNRRLVDDRAESFQWVLSKEIPPRHEVAVFDLERGRQQSAYIDLCPSAEHDAVGIDQEQPAVRLQLAQDHGRIDARHTV